LSGLFFAHQLKVRMLVALRDGHCRRRGGLLRVTDADVVRVPEKYPGDVWEIARLFNP
jgi:hypothetical protein